MGDLADEPIPGEPSWVKHGSPWQRRLLRQSRGPQWRSQHQRSRYPLYVRFGEPPEGGRSTTYRKEALGSGSLLAPLLPGDYEAGVSAFRARRTDDGCYELDVSASVAMAVLFRVFVERSDRQPFELFGREVGAGSAGEPVLAVERFEPVSRSRVRSSGHYQDQTSSQLRALRFGLLLGLSLISFGLL